MNTIQDAFLKSGWCPKCKEFYCNYCYKFEYYIVKVIKTSHELRWYKNLKNRLLLVNTYPLSDISYNYLATLKDKPYKKGSIAKFSHILPSLKDIINARFVTIEDCKIICEYKYKNYK